MQDACEGVRGCICGSVWGVRTCVRVWECVWESMGVCGRV